MKSKLTSEAGTSIIQVMIAGSILAVVMVASLNFFSGVSKSSSKVETSLDLSGIKARIIDTMSCAKTLAAQPTCTTSNTYVALKDDAGRDVIPSEGKYMGKHFLRARCNSGVTGGIEVRAANLTTAGKASAAAKDFGATNRAWFKNDEMNANLPYNWEHPKGKLLAASSGTAVAESRLCQEFFKGTTNSAVVTCTAPGTVMTGYNPLTQQPVCSSVSPMVSSTASCPSGQYMRGIVKGVPQCATDVVGTTTTVVSSTSTTSTSSGGSSYVWNRVREDCLGDGGDDCPSGTAAGLPCTNYLFTCKKNRLDPNLCTKFKCY